MRILPCRIRRSKPKARRRPPVSLDDRAVAVAAFLAQRQCPPPLSGGAPEPWDDFPRPKTAAQDVRERLEAIELYRAMRAEQ
jgi:hypothetical protein